MEPRIIFHGALLGIAFLALAWGVWVKVRPRPLRWDQRIAQGEVYVEGVVEGTVYVRRAPTEQVGTWVMQLDGEEFKEGDPPPPSARRMSNNVLSVHEAVNNGNHLVQMGVVNGSGTITKVYTHTVNTLQLPALSTWEDRGNNTVSLHTDGTKVVWTSPSIVKHGVRQGHTLVWEDGGTCIIHHDMVCGERTYEIQSS